MERRPSNAAAAIVIASALLPERGVVSSQLLRTSHTQPDARRNRPTAERMSNSPLLRLQSHRVGPDERRAHRRAGTSTVLPRTSSSIAGPPAGLAKTSPARRRTTVLSSWVVASSIVVVPGSRWSIAAEPASESEAPPSVGTSTRCTDANCFVAISLDGHLLRGDGPRTNHASRMRAGREERGHRRDERADERGCNQPPTARHWARRRANRRHLAARRALSSCSSRGDLGIRCRARVPEVGKRGLAAHGVFPLLASASRSCSMPLCNATRTAMGLACPCRDLRAGEPRHQPHREHLRGSIWKCPHGRENVVGTDRKLAVPAAAGGRADVRRACVRCGGNRWRGFAPRHRARGRSRRGC